MIASCHHSFVEPENYEAKSMLKPNIVKFSDFYRIFFCGLFPLSCLILIPSAEAGCVSSDVNAQYVIGRSTLPSTQANNTNVQFGENCLGNSSHGNNLQIYSGVEPVQQERQRNVYLNSEAGNKMPLLQTPNLDVRVNQQQYLPILPE